ncbi:short-chain dehydrogenase TIC 32 B, chloroplastic-like [Curcuma longa]|uniref:short-chain dehydrogenase TIC 32 B, chloroplastic-like n=1 Tax=Curcuma longa TaxID=136217 RepID=UPI003D9F57FA
MGYWREATGIKGPSGFGSGSTAEQVTEGIDASALTVVITGGSSGIGAETARVLALRGAHVIIGARNLEAANAVKQSILESTPSARIDIIQIELSSLKSVRAFADKFLAMDLPINILINNAGVMYCPFQLSEDGIEMQFATNHLGHFLLTNLLLDKLKSTAEKTGIEGRIVNLSSIAHIGPYSEGIMFDKLNDKKAYNDKSAYGQSKLANILHSNELARRLKEEGANVTANSVHPGLIRTNLGRHAPVFLTVLRTVTCILWKSIPQGAATTCYVALHPSLKGVSGKYFADSNEEKPTAKARDAALAKKLWDFSQELVDSKS